MPQNRPHRELGKALGRHQGLIARKTKKSKKYERVYDSPSASRSPWGGGAKSGGSVDQGQIGEGRGQVGAKRGDKVLAGNHLTTGSAAICTTHLSAFGLFQFDCEMLTEWQVTLLGPPSLHFSCFSLGHISRLEGGWKASPSRAGHLETACDGDSILALAIGFEWPRASR